MSTSTAYVILGVDLKQAQHPVAILVQNKLHKLGIEALAGSIKLFVFTHWH
jgi:hypothetical protein